MQENKKGIWSYIHERWYRLALAIAVPLIVIGGVVTAAVILLYRPPLKDCGYDTGYTCMTGDVMTNMSFKCTPDDMREWYRTDQSMVIDPSDPNTMYVSVEWKGVYKTTDGGQTWQQKTKGIRVYADKADMTKGCYSEYPVIRIDPFDHKHLVIAISGGGGGFLDADTPNGQTGGVYQSFDGGDHWKLMINNHMNRYVNDIAIDPVQKGTVYYTTSSIPASYQEADQTKRFVTVGLVYKTTDYGKKWTELPTGTGDNSNARELFINPANNEELILPTWSAVRKSADGTGAGVSTGKDTNAASQLGTLRSLDGGKTWKQAFSTFTDYPILYTYVAPQNIRHMYSVITEKAGETSVYGLVTTDGTTRVKTKYVDLVAYDPHDPKGNHMLGFTTVIVGPDKDNFTLWESNDAGINWHRYGTLPKEFDSFSSPLRPSNIVWHPTDPKVVYMTGGGGHIWKSTDTGKTWTSILDYTKLH